MINRVAVGDSHAPDAGGDHLSRAGVFVDRSIFSDSSSFGVNYINAPLERVVRKDLRHHYSGPICASRWIALCKDPSYGHRRLVALIGSALPALIRALEADAGDLVTLDLVSLGPGDGSVDLRILRSLRAALQVGHYYCIDSSFELLCHAVGSILRDRKLKDLTVRAVCGDFEKTYTLLPSDGSRAPVRLFTLTGFTLGNFAEQELLSQISRVMSERDYLLLDARLHNLAGWNGRRKLRARELSKVLGHYLPDSVRRFVFGPVETMTLAKSSDVSIGYEVRAKITSIPRAVEIVIFCRSLDTTMRFTGQRIRKRRLDLAATSLYDYSDLEWWLKMRGWRPVWQTDTESTGLFLLRKACSEGTSGAGC